MSDTWMGSIAAQDQYRPLGNDPWTNTMRGTAPAPGQGFEPVQQSPVLYNTKAGPITEADIENTIGIGMGVSGGGLKTDIVKAPSIKAFHSSPHDFDKFDLAKIGTGEGAQVYGHGLYFAESPAVSGQGGQYWKQFLPRFKDTPEGEAARKLWSANFDREAAAKAIQEAADRYTVQPSKYVPASEVTQRKAELMRQHELLMSGQPVGPRTYEVNIKADPAHMLDWDTKIGQQTPAVQDYFRKQIEQFGPEASMEAQYKIARSRAKGGGVELSAGMSEAGIPGIKYLDQGSRMMGDAAKTRIAQIERALQQSPSSGTPLDDARIAKLHAEIASIRNPTSNYVVFDPSIIDIMKKYGIAGAAPAGMGALAAQDAYRSE